MPWAPSKACKQCRAIKPIRDFYPERKGFKVRFCWACAAANMAKYWRGRNVGRMPDEIREIKD